MTCHTCKRPLAGTSFSITRHVQSPAGVVSSVDGQVCSLTCLIRWAYDFGTRRGLEGVQRAAGAFDELLKMLRG